KSYRGEKLLEQTVCFVCRLAMCRAWARWSVILSLVLLRGAGGADNEPAEIEEEREPVPTAVLSNDHFPDLATSIRHSLERHRALDDKGRGTCLSDGSVRSQELQKARQEVIDGLRSAGLDPDAVQSFETPGVDQVYKGYQEYIEGCPQAVLQGTLAKLERLLQHLRKTCGEQELFRACQ
ncbi:unnamed protein product, partial [Polarella glacialis]